MKKGSSSCSGEERKVCPKAVLRVEVQLHVSVNTEANYTSSYQHNSLSRKPSRVCTQVNKIRESLGRNSTAAGLRQPHLERTRLCQLSDAELDPVYVRQRNDLRTHVRQLARPKSVNGQVAVAPGLLDQVTLLKQQSYEQPQWSFYACL